MSEREIQVRYTIRELETAFADWVQCSGWAPDVPVLVAGEEWCYIEAIARALLPSSTNTMPRSLCLDVGLDPGSTYCEGAQAVLSSLGT